MSFAASHNSTERTKENLMKKIQQFFNLIFRLRLIFFLLLFVCSTVQLVFMFPTWVFVVRGLMKITSRSVAFAGRRLNLMAENFKFPGL